MSSQGSDFVVTKEHRRFAEFCDACRRYRYIGLCYGPPGVGKTLSARAYAQWDIVEASQPVQAAASTALAVLMHSHTVFYTPPVVNSPTQIARDIAQLRQGLHAIQWEQIEREERAQVDAALTQEKDKQDQRLLQQGCPLTGCHRDRAPWDPYMSRSLRTIISGGKRYPIPPPWL